MSRSSTYTEQPAGLAGYFRNITFLNIVAILAVITFFVSYLFINTQSAAKSFSIKEMEHSLAELEDQRRALDMQVTRQQSNDSLQQMVSGKGFVPVANVEYLRKGGAVAAR